MDKTYFATLYDYNYWANRKVWGCVMQLSDEQFDRELDYSIGAIHTQVEHTMRVEAWWFHFLKERNLDFLDMMDDREFSNRASIRTMWDEVEQFVRAYIEALTPNVMDDEVRPPFWEEGKGPIKVWQAMTQVALHSMDHRAQTLAGLHRLGGPTLGQDYLDYLFEMQKVR